MWYTLGDYTLDPQRYELCRAGLPLPLQPKVFELLAYLIEHRDRVVTRQELFDTLWAAQFVSDDALEWLMASARRAVGDSGRAQRVIKTIRSRGYRCVATVEEHPHPRTEVLAHHYTEAGLNEQAIPCWQRAGERAAARSAHREAVAYCTRGLEVLTLLPDTPARAGYALGVHLTLSASLLSLRGPSTPEIEPVWTRARELCEQLGDTTQLPEVLLGLFGVHSVRGKFQAALEMVEQILELGQREHDGFLLWVGHFGIGFILFFRGELVPARAHFEQAMVLYDPQQHSDQALLNAQDHMVSCLCHLAWAWSYWAILIRP